MADLACRILQLVISVIKIIDYKVCGLATVSIGAIQGRHMLAAFIKCSQKYEFPCFGIHVNLMAKLWLPGVACFLKLNADQVLVFEWIVGTCQVKLL